MRKRSELSVIIGVLLWVGLLSGGFLLARHSARNANDAVSEIGTYITKPRRMVELNFASTSFVQVGDPIFLGEHLIGRVARVEQPNSTDTEIAFTKTAFAELYSNAPKIAGTDRMLFHHTPDSISWVVQTMLPPETRQEISTLIVKAYEEEKDEIIQSFRPIIENSVREASLVVREDFKSAFEKREQRIRVMGERFKSELVEQELLPLLKEEIWPIVRLESEPLVSEIGQEMWREVSLWRLGWKALYDKSPLPKKDLAKKEFETFVDEKALVILNNHSAELLELQGHLIKKISGNDRVKRTAVESIKTIVSDVEVQEMLTEIFKEVFVNNERLEAVMERNWKSPEAEQALANANRKLEPTITRIGQTLFGSPNEEITPEFSRVLRRKILKKDDRWLTLIQVPILNSSSNTDPLPVSDNGYPTIKVQAGPPESESPFHVPAGVSN